MPVAEAHPTADEAMKFGLLMESAQAHQRLAEVQIDKLLAHTRGLDEVVRGEIRRTLVEEFQALRSEGDRAARALGAMKRTLHLRGLAWNLGLSLLCTSIPVAIAHFTLPSGTEIAALRTQRDALAGSLAGLERRGGKADWRLCGAAARLCIRIDHKAPVFGEKGEYSIVEGY